MAYFLGIDVGGTEIKSALIDEKGGIFENPNVLSGKDLSVTSFVAAVKDILSMSSHKHSIKPEKIERIGIGLPGCVNYYEGVVHSMPNINGWKDVPLKNIIESATNAETVIDNDVHMMAIGEFVRGSAKGSTNAVCITLGTGVGGGVIINKHLYRGTSMSAGELGHITVEKEGPLCGCGNRGCLERYVGNKYLVEHAVSNIERGQKTIISTLAEQSSERITPKIIAEAAQKGDKFALSIWERAGEYIGIVLAGVVNFINPEVIVIGGGLANAGSLLLDPIIKTVEMRSLPVSLSKVKITTALLNNLSGSIGAALLAQKKDDV